ncbi:LysR family transcriptional regulator [Desulfosporosinus sp. BG]|uniref:LysR family transcriptional regulator n=1 Tax=Desulfosporosinus sp. BG TaxID=1633135 RepID=UPI00083A6A80|nr:LysR family transcriptional regulator [Desulfosporosinus sp. BG]ODA43028.1 transcription regulator [Desulfosporosinus sp. BG]
MIEIYLLEHLRAFYECGTLSAAAEQLHIAQPSVSRSMQKLEDILEVTLFERQKNRIILNETGKLAAEYAKRILDEEEEMKAHIKAYDRSLHTLTIGSCAPGPLMELLPTATASLSGMTLSAAVDTEEKLLKGLWNSDYGMIVLAKPLPNEDFICKEYRSEQLMLSVPPFHPAASYKEITFADMDGQNFIMYAHVGFWEDVVREKMPHGKFFKQEELANSSDLPSFSSDITLRMIPSRRNNRINIPFSDPESRVTYYLIVLAKTEKLLRPLLRNL